jgi:hypothetical protein
MKNKTILFGILAIFIIISIVFLFYGSIGYGFMEGLTADPIDDNTQKLIIGYINQRQSPDNPNGTLTDDMIIANIQLLGSSNSQIKGILDLMTSSKDAVDKFAALLGQGVYDPLEDSLVIHYTFDAIVNNNGTNIIKNVTKNNLGASPSDYDATVNIGANNPQPTNTIIDKKHSVVNSSCLYLNGLPRSDPATKNSTDNGAFLTIPRLPTCYDSTGFLGMSFSLWFCATDQNGNWARIFDFGIDRDTNNILLSTSSGTSQCLAPMIIGPGWNPWNAYWGDYVCDSNWRHVVWAISKHGYWSIYVNNKVVSNNLVLTPNNVNRLRNYIGKSNWNGTSNPPWLYDDAFNGWIDDFRMYQRELTPDDVQKLYSKGGKLQEQNNYFWVMPDTQNKWYNNSQARRNMGKLTDLGILSNTHMTIAFWMNIQNPAPYWRNIFNINNGAIDCCDNGSRIPSLYIYPSNWINSNTDAILHFRFGTLYNWNDGLKSGGNGTYDYDPNIPFSIGKDVHVTFTIDNKTIKYYLNGVLKYTRTLDNNTRFVNNNSNAALYMNTYSNCDGVKLKNFQLFNRSLLADEVMTVYSQLVCNY